MDWSLSETRRFFTFFANFTQYYFSINLSSLQVDNATGQAEPDFLPPTEADANTFKEDAELALAGIQIADVSKTDLPESCETSLYPCAAKIVGCTSSRLVNTSQGTITPLTNVCNCFVRGFTEPIEVPNKPNMQFTCSYTCVESLLKATSHYVGSANGPLGGALDCDSSVSSLAADTFGNKNGYIPSQTETDSLDVIPVDDPSVVRAAEALRIAFNSRRRLTCPALHSFDEPGTVKYAKRGLAAGGKSQYRLEVVFGNDVVLARLAHLPKSQQTVDPTAQATLDDPTNLDGRFELVSSVPGPCDDGVPEQLAVSATGVEAVNQQKLGWTAVLKQEHEGRRVKDFGMGDVPLSEEERKAFYVELDTTDFTPPDAYDARDIDAGQVPCKAFNPLDQGSCGSCYAFSSATAFSARLCRFNPSSLGNIVVSPQQFLDCTNGCDGGNAIAVYQSLVAIPNVELWCDPYTQTKQTCNSICSIGNKVTGQPGSVRTVGGAGPNGVLQMQLELIRGGPGVVSFLVTNDFFSYSSGVYTPSPSASPVGGHAVALVGWGVDSGKPYWIVQNSWGPGWGENGFFRIVRGQDACSIESRSGLAVVKPQAPTACPKSKCANGAVTLKDCTCRCDNGLTGPTCSTCALKCQNGGILDAACSKCACPLGLFGKSCEGGFTVSPLASCVGDSTSVTLTYTFGGTAPPPTQTSLVGFFALNETGPLNSAVSAAVCSQYSKYSANVNGGLCPSKGTLRLSPPSTPGQYKIVLVPWSPLNAQGLQG